MAEKEKEKKVEVVEDDGLVEVRKGSESLRVHPTCVKDHESNGWTQ